ncbi:bifunctional 2-polyprenyl-6-hydroxyphenol methylase/3-demethylubiquinol 3-O-methyltransferase UbiG [Micromonospora sp. HUAS LYJ1]|uniref:class I SAM-dependent methyltransferase n=1 Tax=Micromonospora sp. HUAS LYJ1 TaxID=3061626 RepID=UPI002673D766|nr:methyltransferase domain-containing protein [Micromonospora sp. HUAS LYJ1]WKU05078.1 methyltransferase domain-containing protein [Micromonospora sp. HUAS LYJ1]
MRIRNSLERLALSYPPGRRQGLRREIDRQAFQIGLVHRLAPGGSIADIGGGTGLFSVGCAAVGMTAVLIDDFADPANRTSGDEALHVHRTNGVKIETRDVITDGLGLGPDSMDVITTFDSMEHWHASPKRLFAEVMTALRAGGWFLLGVPNCVALRKRLTVPLGHGKWSSMEVWYEQPTFRGHVREPDVDDLRYIARDMGLVDVRIMGRNWQGYGHRLAVVRTLTPVADRLLTAFPSLCSDLYLLGRKTPC